MRDAYLVLARRLDDAGAFATAAASLTTMLATNWRCVWKGDRAAALVRRGGELACQTIDAGAGMAIGDVLSRDSASAASARLGSEAPTFEQQCRSLSADYWGRYVAVRWPTEGAAAAVFRDPSGALDCLTWDAAGVTLIGSELPDDLPAPFHPKLSVDWDAVGGFLLDPDRSAGALALKGVRAVWPGELWSAGVAAPSTQIWSPARFAAPSGRTDDALQRE